MTDQMHLSSTQISVLTATAPFLAILFNPVGGWVATRIGRVPPLLAAKVFAVAGALLARRVLRRLHDRVAGPRPGRCRLRSGLRRRDGAARRVHPQGQQRAAEPVAGRLVRGHHQQSRAGARLLPPGRRPGHLALVAGVGRSDRRRAAPPPVGLPGGEPGVAGQQRTAGGGRAQPAPHIRAHRHRRGARPRPRHHPPRHRAPVRTPGSAPWVSGRPGCSSARCVSATHRAVVGDLPGAGPAVLRGGLVPAGDQPDDLRGELREGDGRLDGLQRGRHRGRTRLRVLRTQAGPADEFRLGLRRGVRRAAADGSDLRQGTAGGGVLPAGVLHPLSLGRSGRQRQVHRRALLHQRRARPGHRCDRDDRQLRLGRRAVPLPADQRGDGAGRHLPDAVRRPTAGHADVPAGQVGPDPGRGLPGRTPHERRPRRGPAPAGPGTPVRAGEGQP